MLRAQAAEGPGWEADVCVPHERVAQCRQKAQTATELSCRGPVAASTSSPADWGSPPASGTWASASAGHPFPQYTLHTSGHCSGQTPVARPSSGHFLSHRLGPTLCSVNTGKRVESLSTARAQSRRPARPAPHPVQRPRNLRVQELQARPHGRWLEVTQIPVPVTHWPRGALQCEVGSCSAAACFPSL